MGMSDAPDQEFGAQLRHWRAERGLSLAQLSARVSYHRGHLGKIENGQRRASPELAQLCDEVLDAGGALIKAVGEYQEPTRVCPYPGLAAFATEQARWYFGRARETAQLIDLLTARLTEPGPVAVVGLSGVGKSSLLRAGLVPAVDGGALPVGGNGEFAVRLITPGADPLGTWESTLASPTIGARGRALVVIDQFEEAFTLCADEARRTACIEAVCARAREGSTLVVIGLRADFYGHCLAYPQLVDTLRRWQLPLEPMSGEQLRAAVTEPAAAAGLSLESGLTELLLQDAGVHHDAAGRIVGGEPGALPLVSHALRATWQQRTDDTLTVAGYRLVGGVAGSVAATAERAYLALEGPERAAAESLFPALVRVGAEMADGRRSWRIEDLHDHLPAPETRGVLEVFTQARLLTVSEGTVEISHEALLRAWPRLAGWIEADRAGLRIHAMLADAARAWREEDRDPALLLRGSRLAMVRDWVDTPHRRLGAGPVEREFVQAGIAAERDERDQLRRHARRLRQLVVGQGVLLIALLVAALIAGSLWSVANQRKRVADQRGDDILASAYAALANGFAQGRPDLGSQLSASAYTLNPADPATLGALLSTSAERFAGRLEPGQREQWAVAFDPDSPAVLAVSGPEGSVTLYNARTRGMLGTIDTDGSDDLAFAPHGHLLAAVRGSAGKGAVVDLWDVRDPARPRLVRSIPNEGATVNAVAFSPDGATIATAGHDGVGRLWSTATGAFQARLAGNAANEMLTVAFSPDGATVATGGRDDAVSLWDRAGHFQRVLSSGSHSDAVIRIAFNTTGTLLASTSDDKTVVISDTATGAVRQVLAADSDSVWGAAFSPDDTLLATGSYDQGVRLWDPTTGRMIEQLTGHTGHVLGVAFSPDGSLLASASADGSVDLWDITTNRILLGRPATAVHAMATTPDGRTVATGDYNGVVRLWDRASGRMLAELPLAGASHILRMAYSRDGRVLGVVSDDSRVRLVSIPGLRVTELDSAGSPAATGKHWARALAFDPSANLLVTSDGDGTGTIWDTVTDKPLASLPAISGGTFPALAFNPTGAYFGRLETDSVILWDPQGRELSRIPTGQTPAHSLAFGPGGHLLAVGFDDGTIGLWRLNAPTGQSHAPTVTQLSTLAVPAAPIETVKSLAFTPDGTRLAAGAADGTVRLWDLPHSALLATLVGHTDAVDAVAFTPDGQTLISASDDASVRLWDVNPAQDVRRDCGLAARLDRAQWAQLVALPYEPTCP